MATTGSDIKSTDLNTLRNNTVEVLGPGSGTYGYGQTFESYEVTPGQTARKADFDAIRFDLVSIYQHQKGVTPTLPIALTTDPVRAGAADPINSYQTVANDLRISRFDIANFTTTAKDSETYSGSWNTLAEAVLTVTFSTATEARYFFNAGSKIRITTSRSGGTSSPQNNAWTNILDNAGNQNFGAATDPVINYYTLTNSYQDFYVLSTSTPYSANNYQLSAKTDVADNATGTATQLDIRIRLNDSYVDLGPPAPGDLVDGTLTINIEELKTNALLQPSGSPYTIVSPTYSLSSISAS